MSWAEFVKCIRSTRGRWLYRGGLSHWSHETSLERLCRAWGIPPGKRAEVECSLVREFKRHPEVRGHVADLDDHLDWVALMQHHGAPTRLLDWTYSPYVAAYFAFDHLLSHLMSDRNTRVRPTVWALDVDWLEERLKAQLSSDDWTLYQAKDGKSFKKLFVGRVPPLQFIGTATTISLNLRLSVQQGVFLCPGDVTQSWMANLQELGGSSRRPIAAFSMDRETMKTAFTELSAMNVTARSLFPGIDGYAKSMSARAFQLWKTPFLRE